MGASAKAESHPRSQKVPRQKTRARVKPVAKTKSEATAAVAVEGGTEPLPTLGPVPEEVLAKRLAEMKKTRNPLLTAADPLMLFLAKIPLGIISFSQRGKIDLFRAQLEQEMEAFETLCCQANIPPALVVGASYCLCTALDEAVHDTKWGGDTAQGLGAWSQNALSVRFHGDRDGGTKVFQLVGRLVKDPDGNRDLLELIFQVMSLGFMGRYRVDSDGRRNHEHIRQRLYRLVQAGRPPVPKELSRNWRGEPAGKMKPLWHIPVWMAALTYSVILLVMYACFSYQLSVRTDEVVKAILAIGEMRPPSESDLEAEPPPVTPGEAGPVR
ncbi:type IVB secretion system protein IcmH/DotU [Cupriavidus basilensis]|uniref:type IVB secretion system protein IcmH/DotU n=1 Tax=Cupriavidus basilensis TaxID=68895 RepID=UPI0039F6D3F9